MEIAEELSTVKPIKDTAITIGVFDGVHLGHLSLLHHLNKVAESNGWCNIVITFKLHPEMVLDSSKPVTWLENLNMRISQIKKAGIDYVVALDFSTELSRLTAEEFMQLLKDHLKLKLLIIGPDFALGKNREGNADQLRIIGEKIGFKVEVMPPLILNGDIVSNSLIRRMLAGGNLQKANKSLGRNFSMQGEVVSGERRGTTLGFPTANIEIEREQFLLPDGVYATVSYLNGQTFPSVTNIGTCPTFSGTKRVVETHVIDKKLDLLAKMLKIEFVEKLRDEQCFENETQLKIQIEKDIHQAKVLLDELESKKNQSR